MLTPWKVSYDQLRKHIKKQRHYFAKKGPSSQFFQWSCMDVRVGLWRKLSTEELMLLNCGVGEDSWETLDEGERGEWESWLKTQHTKTKIMASGPISSWQIEGETWKQWQTLFSVAPKSLWMVTAAMKLKDTCSLEEQPKQRIKK